jgi:hypothetical protein
MSAWVDALYYGYKISVKVSDDIADHLEDPSQAHQSAIDHFCIKAKSVVNRDYKLGVTWINFEELKILEIRREKPKPK